MVKFSDQTWWLNFMIKPFKLNINVKPKLKLEVKFESLTYKLNVNVKLRS